MPSKVRPPKVRPPNCRMSCTDEDCYCHSFFYSQLLLLLPLLLLPFGCYHMQEIPDKVPWMKVDLWAGFPEIPVDPENPWTKQMWADIASDPPLQQSILLIFEINYGDASKIQNHPAQEWDDPPAGLPKARSVAL